MLSKLSDYEKHVVHTCISCIVNNKHLKHESHTRIGLPLDRAKAILKNWSQYEFEVSNDDDVSLLINNAMNEVCHGMRISDEEWRSWFGSITYDQVKATFQKWKLLHDQG
jgi:hypothetical protein